MLGITNQTTAQTGGFWENLTGSLGQIGSDVLETVTEKSGDIVDGLAEFEYQKWMAEKIDDAGLRGNLQNPSQNTSGQPQTPPTAMEKATEFVSDNALIIGGVVVGSLALILLLRR